MSGSTRHRLAAALALGAITSLSAVAACSTSAPPGPTAVGPAAAPGATRPVASSVSSGIETAHPSGAPSPVASTGNAWEAVATNQGGGKRMYGVTAGHGLFVAVGHAGRAYMPDGDERGTVTMGASELSALSGGAWTSTDGRDWIGSVVYPDFDDAGLEAVTSTSSGFVAVGHSGTDAPEASIWTSMDGKDWYRTKDDPVFAPPDGGGSNLWSVASAGDALVAVGREWSLADGALASRRAVAWFSMDGSTWGRAESIEDGEGAMFNTVASTGSGWVAGGVAADSNTPAIWTSPDGNEWRPAEMTEQGEGAIQSIVQGGPGLVAVGAVFDAHGPRPAAWTSADGAVWDRAQVPALPAGVSAGGISSVSNDGDGLLAIGYLVEGDSWQGTLWTSVDGARWTQSPAIPALGGGAIGPVSNGPLSITSAGSTIVAVGATTEAPAAIWARLGAR